MAQERLGLDDKQWLNFKKIKWAKGVFTSKLIVNGEAVLDVVLLWYPVEAAAYETLKLFLIALKC